MKTRLLLLIICSLSSMIASGQDEGVNFFRLGDQSNMIDSVYTRFLKTQGRRGLETGETWKKYNRVSRIDLMVEEPTAEPMSAALIGPGIALTGSILIKRLEDAAHNLIDHAGDAGAALARTIEADILQITGQLKRDIEDLEKPIVDLNKTIQQTVQKALVTVNQVENFITFTRTCGRQDITLLMNGLSNHIHQLRSDILPWKSYPVVTNIFERGSQTPYGVTIGKSTVIVLEGYNLESDPKSIDKYSVKVFNANSTIKAKITGVGKNAIAVELDTPKIEGNYTIKVDLYKKGFLGIGRKKKTVSNVISVIKKPLIEIRYEITPSCTTYPTIAFNAGEIHLVNGDCNGDKKAGGVYGLPDDWKYTGHQFVETSQNGCTKIDDRYLNDRSVSVMWNCPERGGIFCTGASKWVHGYVLIYGSKPVVESGQTLSGKFPKKVEYGQTIQVVQLEGSGCNTAGWSVSVTLVYEDGTEHSIQTQGGIDQLGNITASNIEGAAFYWSGETRTLTVSTPRRACGF